MRYLREDLSDQQDKLTDRSISSQGFKICKDEFCAVTDTFNTRVAKDETLKPDFLRAMENYILNVANR